MSITTSEQSELAKDAFKCVSSMARLHGKPVQVFSNKTKMLFIVDGPEEHTLTPDYVGTYTADGALEADEDLAYHWGAWEDEKPDRPALKGAPVIGLLELMTRLRLMCNEAGQAELARRIGMHDSYLSEIMRLKRKPSRQVLDALGLVRVVAYAPLDKEKGGG